MTLKKSAISLAAIALLTISVLPANAATKASTTPKPTVSGAPRAGGFGGGFGAGRNSAAFAKYTACLAKAGIKFPSFGGGRGFGAPGTRPSGAPGAGTGTTPRPRPTFSLSPAQQKAFTACAALRPSFGGFNRGTGTTGGASGGAGQGTNQATTGGAAPKTSTSAAYIACLNSHGLPVTSAAQIAGLDKQNTKILAALKACVGK
jgi:hypothetical protein